MASKPKVSDSAIPPRGHRSRGTQAGQGDTNKPADFKKAVELIAYFIMLILVLMYFTGKGLFIYEGF